ncbi:MAG: response regulator [Thermoleophilia bacterium]
MEASEKIRVLLVDDETDYLEITAKRLTRRGYEVTTASDCKTGLASLAGSPVDVVVLDLMLPDMDGNDCLKELRKDYPTLGVIMLTGHASVHTGLTCLENGANDYCLKPVAFDELVEKIEIVYRDMRHGDKTC